MTTVLEYITSYIMEKSFNAKWWDYSHMKFNINGRVCLLNSLEFGILGMALIYLIHPEFLKLISWIPTQYILPLNIFLISLMFLDLLVTLNTMLDLKQRLKKLKELSESILENEAKHIQNTEVVLKLKSIKEEILNKNTILHNRIIEAFPDINFKKISTELAEIKVKIHEKRIYKSMKKLKKRISERK